MSTSKWSTNNVRTNDVRASALETATSFIAPMAAFVAGVVLGGLIVVLLVAQRLPSLCESECPREMGAFSVARPIGSAP